MEQNTQFPQQSQANQERSCQDINFFKKGVSIQMLNQQKQSTDERACQWPLIIRDGEREEEMTKDKGNGQKGELNRIFQFFQKYGAKWTLIAKFFENKSPNCIKNLLYCNLRKFSRKINSVRKIHFKKFNKQIKYESIIRILEACQSFQSLTNQLKQQALSIRRDILYCSNPVNTNISTQLLGKMMQKINNFNYKTRSYKVARQTKKPQKLARKNTQVAKKSYFNVGENFDKDLSSLSAYKKKENSIEKNFIDNSMETVEDQCMTKIYSMANWSETLLNQSRISQQFIQSRKYQERLLQNESQLFNYSPLQQQFLY